MSASSFSTRYTSSKFSCIFSLFMAQKCGGDLVAGACALRVFENGDDGVDDAAAALLCSPWQR